MHQKKKQLKKYAKKTQYVYAKLPMYKAWNLMKDQSILS